MEGGGYAAHQEPRGRRQGEEAEEEKAGGGRQPRAAEGAGGMKFRVSARAPHGVGALLAIGGAVLAGAAVVAWRHAPRGKRDRRLAKQEASDGGVVEDGKGGASAREIDQPDDNVQGGASPRRIDGHDDDNLRGEEEKTEIGPNGLDNGGVTEEIQEVHDDAEIVGNESNSELVEKFDLDSRSSPTEISMHDDVDSEPVEEFYEDSSTKLSEINAHDMDSITVEKADEISVKNDTENDHSSTKNDDIENDQDGITNGAENENSSKNDLKEEIIPNDNEDVEASDQSSHSISRPGIVLDKQSLHGGGTQEAESMENSPTAKQMMHQEQLLDDMTTDNEGETAEAKPGKGAVLNKDVHKQEQPKATAEPVGLAGSPALSSLDKLAEKKEPELSGRIETGMKMEQDYTNGGLKERGLITNGGATPGGGAVMTMDRRTSSMAILALMFALTIGIAIVVRLYAPQRATKLQMDMQ